MRVMTAAGYLEVHSELDPLFFESLVDGIVLGRVWGKDDDQCFGGFFRRGML